MERDRKKIFITGGTGLLGHYLVKTALDVYDISCTFYPEFKKDSIGYNCAKYHLDIRNRESVLDLIKKIKPDHIIHAASVANVDYIEKNKEEARRTNFDGLQNLIKGSKEVGAAFIFISSNAVFDGENPPYREDDPVNPLNYYGMLKVEEEAVVRNSGLHFAIVRPILMYGWNLSVERKNPVTWLIDVLKNNKNNAPVNMVEDVFCNPLYVADCAEVIWKIIELNKTGTFHVAGEDEMSRYDFALATADVFDLNRDLIMPVKNSFFKGIAPRPQNTTYCIDKIKKELNVFPCGVLDGLKRMKEQVS